MRRVVTEGDWRTELSSLLRAPRNCFIVNQEGGQFVLGESEGIHTPALSTSHCFIVNQEGGQFVLGESEGIHTPALSTSHCFIVNQEGGQFVLGESEGVHTPLLPNVHRFEDPPQSDSNTIMDFI